MAGISISVNDSGIDKMLLTLATLQDQLPYAASRTLNDAAKQMAADLNQSTNQYFDRPTRFTQNAYRVSMRSSKTNLTAELRPKPIQERYLLPSITGGIRPQRPSERRLGGVTPAFRPGADVKLNAYGNISKAAVVKAINGGGSYFTLAEQRGKLSPGVYQRVGSKKVRSILSFNKLPNIPRRWPVEQIGQRSLSANWSRLMNRYLAEAIRTAM